MPENICEPGAAGVVLRITGRPRKSNARLSALVRETAGWESIWKVDSRMLLVIGARVQRFNDIYKTKVCVHGSSYDQPQYSTPKRLHRHFSNLQANAYQTAPFSTVNQAHR